MQCKKIQELLKTDYLDGEVNQRDQQCIREHLAQCADCRRLKEELLAQRVSFQKAEYKQPPERIWQNIHDTIVSERLKEEKNFLSGIFERLRKLIFVPRPVFALAGSLAAIIFTVIIAGTIIQGGRQSSNRDNGLESFADYALNGENEDLLYGLGTNIEEYFL